MAALFSLSSLLPAQAQQPPHSWNITYDTTGTDTYAIPNSPAPGQSTPQSYPFSGIESNTNINGNLSGTITATLTWVPATGKTRQSDPPPEPVYIKEFGQAEESPSTWNGPGSAPTLTGSADDGLGDKPVGWYNDFGLISTGTHLVQRDGSSGTITLGPFSVSAVNPTSSWVAGPYNSHYWDWMGGLCEDVVSVQTLVTLPLSATYINKDLPTNTAYGPLPSPLVLYGGSIRSTSDELLLDAGASSVVGTTYTWSASGTGTGTPPATNASTWNVVIPPTPSLEIFQCSIQVPGTMPVLKTLTVELGIRTDDTILIGWINPQGVTMPGAGVSTWLTNIFPPNGPPITSLNDKYECLNLLSGLSQNYICDDSGHDFSSPQINRSYMLDWLFKYSGNQDPATIIPLGNFQDISGAYINYPKVDAFVGTATNYKLFNHLQIKYRKNPNSSSFNGYPIVLNRSFSNTAIGTTIDPILGAQFPGQHGPNEGLLSIFSDHVSIINDGSPDASAIKAFNTLSAQGTTNPLFWENIGSQIRFKADGSTTPIVVWQNYPTYNEYINGALVFVNAEAEDPIDHFYSNPYPFGTVPSTSDGGTLSGGRNGDAASAADPSARNPAYTIP